MPLGWSPGSFLGGPGGSGRATPPFGGAGGRGFMAGIRRQYADRRSSESVQGCGEVWKVSGRGARIPSGLRFSCRVHVFRQRRDRPNSANEINASSGWGGSAPVGDRHRVFFRARKQLSVRSVKTPQDPMCDLLRKGTYNPPAAP